MYRRDGRRVVLAEIRRLARRVIGQDCKGTASPQEPQSLGQACQGTNLRGSANAREINRRNGEETVGKEKKCFRMRDDWVKSMGVSDAKR
jgi:hypothetical protein